MGQEWLLQQSKELKAAGVPVPPVDPLEGNSWTPLAVSKHYKAAFAEFLSHYERELEALADAEGGEESEDHQHLAEHTQKLLGLMRGTASPGPIPCWCGAGAPRA